MAGARKEWIPTEAQKEKFRKQGEAHQFKKLEHGAKGTFKGSNLNEKVHPKGKGRGGVPNPV
jgi:hypothetical protein